MYSFFYNFIFVIISLYFGLQAIIYGIYEIKNESNKSGGIYVIAFSILVVLGVNIIIFLR